MLELEIRSDEEGASPTVYRSARPISIGRAPSSELVLNDDLVSWHHALVWTEQGTTWVKDLGSRNGTFVNDQRIQRPTGVTEDDVIRLGTRLTMKVRNVGPAPAPSRTFVLHDLDLGLNYPLRGDRFRIGSGPEADLRIEGAGEGATVLLPGHGEVWLGEGEEDRALEVNQEFEVAGRRFCIREMDSTRMPTLEASPDQYPYKVTARMDRTRGGPEVEVVDERSGLKFRVEEDNRATLLYLLARQLARDTEANLPPSARGWAADEDVSVGIWGKTPTARDANSLHVLVYRVRRELKQSGFDQWLVEKRKRYIRLRCQTVHVEG